MSETPFALLGLTNADAEIAVLHAMRLDTNAAIDLAQSLTPQDFYDSRRALVFEAITTLLMGIEPIDTGAILAECHSLIRQRTLKLTVDEAYIEALDHGDIRRSALYANTVRKLAWLRRAGDFTFWLIQELQARRQPDDLFAAAQERWHMLAPKSAGSNFVYGWDTLRTQRDEVSKRIQQRKEGALTRFDWPWPSWNKHVRPLLPGMVGILAAPDGHGKSIILEQIAEHWAQSTHRVVLVHLEDSLHYKLDRRSARHALIPLEHIEDGDLTPDEQERLHQADQRISLWADTLHYYHAAGQSMTTIVRELTSRVAEGICTAVVFDYLDKVHATRGQARLYGENVWERQANDMEQLKTFAENAKVPVFTATQGNKHMQESGMQTRKNIQGSGQKSQKAQLVLILTRDLVSEAGLRDKTGRLLAEPGEYSPVAKIRIDKQNRGRTALFEQFIMGQFFSVRDIQLQHPPPHSTL